MGQTPLTPQNFFLFLLSICILAIFICYVVYLYYKTSPKINYPEHLEEQFNIELQYQECLSLLGIDESTLPESERKERKRMFFSACGQILMLCTEELPSDESKAAELLQKMIKECEVFWTKETELLDNLSAESIQTGKH